MNLWCTTFHAECLCARGAYFLYIDPGGEALVRELREELNIEITAPVGRAMLTRQDAEIFKEVWLVEKWNGDISNAAPDEHDEIGWFSLDEAMSLKLADADYPALFNRALGDSCSVGQIPGRSDTWPLPGPE